jgi:hypothetical protein
VWYSIWQEPCTLSLRWIIQDLRERCSACCTEVMFMIRNHEQAQQTTQQVGDIHWSLSTSYITCGNPVSLINNISKIIIYNISEIVINLLSYNGEYEVVWCKSPPTTVAARSKAWTVFVRSNTEIVGLNPTWDGCRCEFIPCLCYPVCR